jgi:hypothetical protein
MGFVRLWTCGGTDKGRTGNWKSQNLVTYEVGKSFWHFEELQVDDRVAEMKLPYRESRWPRIHAVRRRKQNQIILVTQSSWVLLEIWLRNSPPFMYLENSFLTLDPILGQMNLIYNFTLNSGSLHFSIILLSNPKSPMLSLTFRFSV